MFNLDLPGLPFFKYRLFNEDVYLIHKNLTGLPDEVFIML